MAVGAAVIIIVSPAVMNPAGYDMYQTPRLVVQALAVLTVLLATVVSRGLPTHRALVPLGALLITLTLSALLSDAPSVSLLGTSSRRFGVLGWLLLAGCFVVGLTMSSHARRRLLIRSLLMSSVVVSVFALLQRVGWDPFAPRGQGPVLRPGSTLGSATLAGGYLAVVVGCGVGAFLVGRTRWVWLAPVGMLALVTLLLTQSRGGWLGALAAIVIVLLAARHNLRSKAGLTLGAIAVVAVITLVAAPGLLARAASLSRPAEGTAGGRVELAVMGVNAIIHRPLLGWGPDESRTALHRQIPATFERRFRDDRIEDRAHNTLIDIAIWGGVIGLAMTLWFVGAVARASWRGRDDWTVVAIAAGVVAYLCHLLFNFPVPELDSVVWLLAGSLVSAVHVRRIRLPLFVAGAVACILTIAVLVPSVDWFVADRHLRQGIDAENRGNLAGAGLEYSRADRADPGSSLYLEVLARWLLRSGDASRAVGTARLASASDPSDPYLAELFAKTLDTEALATGDQRSAAEAESILIALLKDSPNDGSLHLELGNAVSAQGRLSQAEIEYQRAVELVPHRSEPYRNLGLLAEQRSDLTTAKSFLQRAVSANPGDEVAKAALQRVSAKLAGP